MNRILAVLLLMIPQAAMAVVGHRLPDEMVSPIIEGFLQEANKITDLPIPKERPAVYLSPRNEIAAAYCDANSPCSVIAVTDDVTGDIYLSSSISFTSVFNQSIFFHEVVHFMQVKSKHFSYLSGCRKWAAEEMHAYKAQSSWLILKGYKGFDVPDMSKQCVD